MTEGTVLMHVEGNVLVRHDSVMVQVRAGELTLETLGALMTHLRHLMVTSSPPTKRMAMGYLAVLEEQAPIVAKDVRERQREAITQMMARADVRVGIVILGDDVGAAMRRTMARLVAPGKGTFKVLATVPEACRYVCEGLPVDSRALEASVKMARDLAQKRSPKP